MLEVLFIINGGAALGTLIVQERAAKKLVGQPQARLIRNDMNIYALIYAAVFTLFFVLGALSISPDMQLGTLKFLYVCATTLFVIVSIGMAKSAQRHVATVLGNS